MAPAYINEKRYSYQVLATHVQWISDYQQSDPSTTFEQQVQLQYAAAFGFLKQGQYAKALDAFQQLQNLILTSLHPALPPTSYWNKGFIAPMDASLVDTLATKAGSILQSKPLPSYNFPAVEVQETAALAPEVAKKLAPFETAGLSHSAHQIQLETLIERAISAASANDWHGAVAAFTAALQQVPPAAAGLQGAVIQDLAISTEKSGGNAAAAIALAQKSADLFGASKIFDAQVEVLTTLAGMQQRAGDAAGSAKSLATAAAIQEQQRLYPVGIPTATRISSVATHVLPSPSLSSDTSATPISRGESSTAAAPTLARAATFLAAAGPRLMSSSLLATLPPERAYVVSGSAATVSVQLTGNLGQNVRGFLQTISNSTDLSLLIAASSADDPTQLVAYLPSLYFYVIPMAMGDCLTGLGNLEEAATTYAGVLVYPYINQTYEIPKLWNKLAAVYLAMGDRDYRNAADNLAAFPTAKADYEHIIKTDGSLDATSPLWADARFAAIKTRVTAFAAAGFPATFADNPEILSKVMEARVRLRQIATKLDYFGLAVNFLPPFSWEYLQNTAKYFAQQSSQMEQRYIQYTSAGEDETLQRQQLEQQAQVAAQTVILEQRGRDEAVAGVALANAGLNYAQVQKTNAQKAQAEFASVRGQLAEYSELEAWANAASVDQNDEVSLTISGYSYYNTSGTRRSLVIQDLEAKRTKVSQDLEASSLQRNLDAANAYVTQAQAQVAAAQTQVAISDQRIVLAQLQQRDAEENRDYLDMKEFNARLWFDLAANARKISQRYTDMATAVALLAQRAYNAETGRSLNVIRGDYTHSATDNLMGADFLNLDLDTFTYDYVTTTKSKKAPVKRIVSLADNYPYAFNQLRTTGLCTFQTELAMFDRQTPGMYLCKLRNVELVFVGITQANVAGTLRNIGLSRFRQANGTSVARLYPADVMPLSAYEVRQDALAFRVNPNDLQLFENNGIDTQWQLDMPLSANDLDFGSIIDIQLVLYYDGFFDPALETTIKAALPAGASATRVTSMQLTFPDELFYLKSQGQAQLTFDATLFPMTQKNLQRKKSSIRVSGFATTINALTLRVTSSFLATTFTVKTDANGLVAGTIAGDPLFALNGQPVFDTLSIAIKPEDNPQLVKAGRLDLSGVNDLSTYVEYSFDYR